MLNSSISGLSGTVEPVFTQEPTGSTMKNSTQSTQLGQQILQIVLGTPDPQQLLTSIAKTVGEAFQVDTCLVGVTQSPTIDLLGVWQTGASSELIRKKRVKLQNHPLWKVDQWDGNLLTIPDWEASSLGSVRKRDWDSFPARAVLSVRTRFQGKLNGAIILGRSQPHQWTRQEQALLEAITDPVAVAIAQAQLTSQVLATSSHHRRLRESDRVGASEDLRSRVEDCTAQLQQTLDVQATLYEKTRQHIHQLQELNQLKDEFMSSMSHELRTPLTAMSLAIRMLRQPELAPERREKYLEILEQQCNREIDLIEDLLSLQRLESDRASIQPQPVDLVPLIQKLAQSFAEKWGHKPLTLDVDCEFPSLVLSTDPESLHRILWELLVNAGKYSHPYTTVRLKVAQQTHAAAERVVFALTNIGAGIAPDDLNHIFEKFRRGQGVTQQAVPGTGLGLALVKCLVQQLNGTIEVSTYPAIEERATAIAFELVLPQLSRRS